MAAFASYAAYPCFLLLLIIDRPLKKKENEQTNSGITNNRVAA